LSGGGDLLQASNGAVNHSTVILFLNAAVALHNFLGHPFFGAGMGAHPFAFDAYTTQLSTFGQAVFENGALISTNKKDAASLFLRLMSETGIFGTLAFCVMCFSAIARARRAILGRISAGQGAEDFVVISVGFNGAMLGLFAACMFRIGSYYSLPFWLLFAVCAAIPQIPGMRPDVSRDR
jgi:hypothetical protein